MLFSTRLVNIQKLNIKILHSLPTFFEFPILQADVVKTIASTLQVNTIWNLKDKEKLTKHPTFLSASIMWHIHIIAMFASHLK